MIRTNSIMTTLKNVVTTSGRVPFGEEDVEMKIYPTITESGFVFVVDGVDIPVLHEHVVPMPQGYNTTVLEKDHKRVMFTEHLLSALVGFGVDSAKIELIGGNQPPFLDPCALAFFNLIKSVGISSRKGNKKTIVVNKEIVFGDGGSYAIISPSINKKMTIICDYPIPIGVQYFSINLSDPEVYFSQIAWARTFIRIQMGREEWDARRRIVRFLPEDIKKSPIPVADKDGKWIVVPTASDEPARHKILDLIGDLAVLGIQIEGDIFVVRPGHDFNRKWVKYLGGLIEKNEV